MQPILIDEKKDALGAMLLDYLAGDHRVELEVHSDEVEIWTMSGEVMFRQYGQMDDLEQTALSCCRGNILDAGAGSGCHSLFLQETGREVTALDISPGCIEVMKRRGVNSVVAGSLFLQHGKSYDTILMLMNGLGLCGTIEGCDQFLKQSSAILNKGGQIIADSTDLQPLYGDLFNNAKDNYTGEIGFTMHYQQVISDPFSWLYIDFDTLLSLTSSNGLCCEPIVTKDDGRYLVRIFAK